VYAATATSVPAKPGLASAASVNCCSTSSASDRASSVLPSAWPTRSSCCCQVVWYGPTPSGWPMVGAIGRSAS
jgi:hypothetical protein